MLELINDILDLTKIENGSVELKTEPMDVQMPVMDGYEATKQIRNSKNPLGRTIPIIAMTANAFQEDKERSVQAGMNAHISKPIDMKVLCDVMNTVRNRNS